MPAKLGDHVEQNEWANLLGVVVVTKNTQPGSSNECLLRLRYLSVDEGGEYTGENRFHVGRRIYEQWGKGFTSVTGENRAFVTFQLLKRIGDFRNGRAFTKYLLFKRPRPVYGSESACAGAGKNAGT